jgi:hypothetical protein
MRLLVFSLCLATMAATAAAQDCTPVITRTVELPCGDCDGIALGDINGNGRMDILASDGKGCATFWFEQGAAPDRWTRHPIYQIADRPCEIEGNDLGDFNGDGRLETVSLDQPGGRIFLHRQGPDPTQPWETAAIRTGRPLVQASLVTDIDGDSRADLVYTWEGREPGAGGVHWLRFTGANLLDPDHWTDHRMIRHESAWWLAPRRVDLGGNGRATDIVFSARNLTQRNPGAQPGVFWLEEPENVFGEWARHDIDRTLNHPLHIDLGDLSGNGHGHDVVVGGFHTPAVYWYEFSNGWRRHALPLPEEVNGVAPNRVWNVKALNMGSSRDGVLAIVAEDEKSSAMVYYPMDNPASPSLLRLMDYNHPMEDRIILYDLEGDGVEEAFIPDSGTGSDRLFIFGFGCE